MMSIHREVIKQGMMGISNYPEWWTRCILIQTRDGSFWLVGLAAINMSVLCIFSSGIFIYTYYYTYSYTNTYIRICNIYFHIFILEGWPSKVNRWAFQTRELAGRGAGMPLNGWVELVLVASLVTTWFFYPDTQFPYRTMLTSCWPFVPPDLWYAMCCSTALCHVQCWNLSRADSRSLASGLPESRTRDSRCLTSPNSFPKPLWAAALQHSIIRSPIRWLYVVLRSAMLTYWKNCTPPHQWALALVSLKLSPSASNPEVTSRAVGLHASFGSWLCPSGDLLHTVRILGQRVMPRSLRHSPFYNQTLALIPADLLQMALIDCNIFIIVNCFQIFPNKSWKLLNLTKRQNRKSPSHVWTKCPSSIASGLPEDLELL